MKTILMTALIALGLLGAELSKATPSNPTPALEDKGYLVPYPIAGVDQAPAAEATVDE